MYWVLPHTLAVNPYTLSCIEKSLIFWEWEGKCSAFDEPPTWQPSLSFQLPLDALTGGWRFQGITRTNNSTYTCFGRYTNHTSFLAPVTNWCIFCFVLWLNLWVPPWKCLLTFFFFSDQNNSVPTAKMCHMLSQRKDCQVKRERCALRWGITALSSFPGKQRKCIWVLQMQQGNPPLLKYRFIYRKVNLTSLNLFKLV